MRKKISKIIKKINLVKKTFIVATFFPKEFDSKNISCFVFKIHNYLILTSMKK